MKHRIDVSGQDGNLIVKTDSEEPKVFSRDNDIFATDLYDALHYHAGDTYVLERGEPGDIKEDTFNAFCKLMQDIVDGIGKLSVSKPTDDNADEKKAMNKTDSRMSI
jgi:hypothetical protein